MSLLLLVVLAGCDTVSDEPVILEQRDVDAIRMTFELDPATATEQGVMVARGELLLPDEEGDTIVDELDAFLQENGYTQADVLDARLIGASLDLFRLEQNDVQSAILRFEAGNDNIEVAETSFDEMDAGRYVMDLIGRDVTGFVRRSNFAVVLRLDVVDVDEGLESYTVDARLRFRIEVEQ